MAAYSKNSLTDKKFHPHLGKELRVRFIVSLRKSKVRFRKHKNNLQFTDLNNTLKSTLREK